MIHIKELIAPLMNRLIARTYLESVADAYIKLHVIDRNEAQQFKRNLVCKKNIETIEKSLTDASNEN